MPAASSRLLGLCVAAAVGAVTALGGSAAGASAQGPRAGVVVMMPDGSVSESCVTLPPGRVTGMELLERAGFDVVAEVNALGSTVCAIDGTGCGYPAEPCWCQCRSLGAECTYWAYHVSDGAAWRYSTLGAAARVVADGDVDGWAWGPGQEGSGAVPPFRSFDQVCRADTSEEATTEPSRPEDPDPSDEPEQGEADPHAGRDEADGSNATDLPPSGAASPTSGAALSVSPPPGSRAPSEATVEALATALARAAQRARAGSGDAGAAGAGGVRGASAVRGQQSGAAAGRTTVAPIALQDLPASSGAIESDEGGTAPAGDEGRAGYAVAGLVLTGLALGSWAVRRRGG